MTWQSQLQAEFDLNPGQLAAFKRLQELLAETSDRNLTAVTGSDRIVDIHFRDSLSLLAIPEFQQAISIADIGSGAGFPGLPLAIACPTKKFSLIESNSRKCDFLEHAVRSLGLLNVHILPLRAEEAGHSELRESFDLALARAVGPMAVVLEYALPLLLLGGYAMLQRGAHEDGDSEAAATIASRLGGEFVSVSPISSYPGSKNLHLWLFRKISPTSPTFPRRPGMAKKRPLKP